MLVKCRIAEDVEATHERKKLIRLLLPRALLSLKQIGANFVNFFNIVL